MNQTIVPIGKAYCFVIMVAIFALQTPTWLKAQEKTATRGANGLQVLYDFSEEKGNVIHDRSRVGAPLNLKIENEKAVRRNNEALQITGKTLIRTDKPASRLNEAIKRSGEVSIEAWVTPSDLGLDGPARMVTISKDSSQRNITLGQDKDKFDVRLRTTKTSTNGIPSISTPSKAVKEKLTHLVYTRQRSGQARLYVNGQRTVDKKVAGTLENWNSTFRLALGNELSKDRPWKGTFHLVAVYSRAMTPKQVQVNFQAGSNAKATGGASLASKSPQEEFFEEKVAAVLVDHCIECHDSASKKGELDLSRKLTALAGGESGKVIVPGKSSESLLWKQITSGDMPPAGTPLTVAEKATLKKWIDTGAVYSTERIDPVLYAHGVGDSTLWVQRLTVPEYIETVRSAVGVDIEKEARALLPPDLRADGFSNTAYNLNVDLKHVNAYSQLAEKIVSKMNVLEFASRFSKSKKLSTDDTMRQFVESMGAWLFRGPLDEREERTYSGIATTVASAGGDYEEAVSFIIEAMLQSPRFIYRIESQRGDGSQWPVDGYELASRMSYIIWGGPPDQKLLDAANAGDLYDLENVEKHIQRMLEDPRAVEHSTMFISEWLNLGQLADLNPDAKRFPNWEAALAVDMREETLAFFKDVVWDQKRPLSDLMNAQVTYATPRLAKHYGLKPKGAGLKRYDVSSVPYRGGLMTQGSVLTVGGDDASMVTRGLYVLHGILRGTVNDPPPGLDTTPVPSKPGQSHRGSAEKRISNVSCGGCHKKFEPLAFGLEKFDGLGAFHKKDEHGNVLREDGEILFPGESKPVKYATSAELMNLLAGSERVQKSFTWKVTQFVLGRPLVAADAQTIEKIHKSAQKEGGTYAALITSIVMSDLVQMTRTEQTE